MDERSGTNSFPQKTSPTPGSCISSIPRTTGKLECYGNCTRGMTTHILMSIRALQKHNLHGRQNMPVFYLPGDRDRSDFCIKKRHKVRRMNEQTIYVLSLTRNDICYFSFVGDPKIGHLPFCIDRLDPHRTRPKISVHNKEELANGIAVKMHTVMLGMPQCQRTAASDINRSDFKIRQRCMICILVCQTIADVAVPFLIVNVRHLKIIVLRIVFQRKE